MGGRAILCRFSGQDGEEMYIHFMVISQRGKCTFAAAALALLPIGWKEIAFPSKDHLNPCKYCYQLGLERHIHNHSCRPTCSNLDWI